MECALTMPANRRADSITTIPDTENELELDLGGKRNEKLILPLNDSVSATLSLEQMHAKTSIAASPKFKEDKIWLNGKEETFDNQRLRNCLQEMRKRARQANGVEGDADLCNWHVHVCSENNFPTAAGLASSAAGYACLVYTLGKLYNVIGDISGVARQGSGSACRSVYGGFVRWHRGSADDGTDSIASQIVPANHWPEMRVLILVVNDRQKKTSSTSGMQRSVQTSDLLKYRVEKCVPQRTEDIIQAIHQKDFASFAEITMKDSNQFHAVCLDTFPPATYMNDTSHLISQLVHSYNAYCGCNQVAYTFDAGPNACLYLLESEVKKMMALINFVFPPAISESVEYQRGLPIEQYSLPQDLKSKLGIESQAPGALQYIIHTQVGNGPQTLQGSDQHLLNEAGVPKKLIS